MTKVFLGGSRRITRLEADVRRRLDRFVEERVPVVVGDANGADKAFQEHLKRVQYDRVEVFCAGDSCRNNLADWPVRYVPSEGRKSGFRFYAVKDRAMAEEAAFGLMLWDQESAGTLMNVRRLLKQGKTAAVHLATTGESVEIKSDADWNDLVAGCPADLLGKIERESSFEDARSKTPKQGTLFDPPG